MSKSKPPVCVKKPRKARSCRTRPEKREILSVNAVIPPFTEPSEASILLSSMNQAVEASSTDGQLPDSWPELMAMVKVPKPLEEGERRHEADGTVALPS